MRMTQILLILASTSLLATGCVHRRLTINSNPPGALVRIDGKDIGYTPASLDYTWYGTREVQLVKDGFETQTQLIDVNPPWYQRFPLDFISDNLLGTHIRDDRQFNLQMRPKTTTNSEGIINRGRSLRSDAVHGL